jgi:hypothetical protein
VRQATGLRGYVIRFGDPSYRSDGSDHAGTGRIAALGMNAGLVVPTRIALPAAGGRHTARCFCAQ